MHMNSGGGREKMRSKQIYQDIPGGIYAFLKCKAFWLSLNSMYSNRTQIQSGNKDSSAPHLFALYLAQEEEET